MMDDEQKVVKVEVVNNTDKSNDKNTLLLVAFIFNLISTVGTGWLIIPLAWMIPMTVISYKIYQGERENTTAFGVCDLIFVSVVAGILTLVAKND